MALKIKFSKADLDIVPDGTATARVNFRIRDDASVGNLLNGVTDQAQFTPSFPLTKAGFKAEAIAAVQVKYPGATEE